MIKKIFMVATLVTLIFLIIITPTFISRQTSLGAVPLVIIDNLRFTILVDIHSTVEPYRYKYISIDVTSLDNSNGSTVVDESETYDLHVVIQKNDTRRFHLNITLFDQAWHGYDYNATVEVKSESEGGAILVRRADSTHTTSTNLMDNFEDTLISRRESS